MLFGGILAYRCDMGVGVWIGDCFGQFSFLDIASEDGRFAGKEEELATGATIVIGELGGESGFPFVEVGEEFFDEGEFGFGFLVATLGFFLAGFFAFLEGGNIGEDEFGIDDLDIADGIDGAEFVDDIVVFEATDDLDDGVGFADIGEEFVSEAGSLAGAFDEASDIDEFNSGGNDFL